jgi:hypothetical protein
VVCLFEHNLTDMLTLILLTGFLMADTDDKLLIHFEGNAGGSWQIVNDGVMGGLSQSNIRRTTSGNALFTGNVSLRNNGGFASVRTIQPNNLSDFNGLRIRIKGDGKSYYLRLKSVENNRLTAHSYESRFQTKNGEWTEIRLPFSEFNPVFRGRALRNIEPLDLNAIAEISFMIRDAQEGPFQLEIESVHAYR